MDELIAKGWRALSTTELRECREEEMVALRQVFFAGALCVLRELTRNDTPSEFTYALESMCLEARKYEADAMESVPHQHHD